MSIGKLTLRQWAGWTGLAILLLLATALAIWRGDILRASLDPQVPFQTYTPPPAPPVESGVLPGSVQDFVVNVGDRVYFDLDSYSIRSEAYPRLDAQVAWLQRYPGVTVRIEGNADERGTREYNLALGARRAESVRNYLVDRGIPAARIDTISFGKERPIVEGSNEAAWAQNRNAHTAIVSGAPR